MVSYVSYSSISWFHYGTDKKLNSDTFFENFLFLLVPRLTGGLCYKLWEPEEFGEVNVKTEKRWYFKSDTRSCLQFDYGGCLGNENRYATLKDCLAENNCKYALHGRVTLVCSKVWSPFLLDFSLGVRGNLIPMSVNFAFPLWVIYRNM